mmetsp:Transcript_13125/g.28775  ORF Transcript_13125/g.28775 Transcript_13125/m.28775 type:complete len:118 (+) Transcript_13125:2962-3315(+)
MGADMESPLMERSMLNARPSEVDDGTVASPQQDGTSQPVVDCFSSAKGAVVGLGCPFVNLLSWCMSYFLPVRMSEKSRLFHGILVYVGYSTSMFRCKVLSAQGRWLLYVSKRGCAVR